MFFIFGCWLLHNKFSSCPKNNGFAQVRGLQPSAPVALMRMGNWKGLPGKWSLKHCVYVSCTYQVHYTQ